MLLDQTSTPGTDDWWLMRLAGAYGAGLPRLGRLRSYADGSAMAPVEMTGTIRTAYLRFIQSARLNVAELAVAARVNRMRPVGFKTGAPGDDDGDAQAMANWSRSNMTVGSRDYFSDFTTYGTSYLLATGPTVPSVDAEPMMVRVDAWNAITEMNASRPWLADAGLLVGWDPVAGVDILTLFRPGYMRQAIRLAPKRSSIPSDGSIWSPGRGWSWVSDPVQLGFTQDVPLLSASMKAGQGAFEGHLDTLDRINRGILERLTINAMQSFRQRAINGNLPSEYPADHPLAGQKINYDEVYSAGPAALWMLPTGATVWESTPTDTTQLLNGSKQDLTFFSSATSTPLYALLPDMNNVAAGAADLAREGIIFAVEEMIDRVTKSLVLAQSMNFLALGDTVRADPTQISLIWASVARISIQERATAAQAAKQSGVSQRFINQKVWEMTPAELAEEAQNIQDEAFAAQLSA